MPLRCDHAQKLSAEATRKSNRTFRWSRKRRRPASVVRFPSAHDATIMLALLLSPLSPVAAFTSSRQEERSLSIPGSMFGRVDRRNISPLFASISAQPGNMDFPGRYKPFTGSLLLHLADSKRIVVESLQRRDYQAGLDELQRAFALVTSSLSYQESERVDELLQLYLARAVNDESLLGYEAIQLFFGVARHLTQPFCLVPKRTMLDLIKALTAKASDARNSQSIQHQLPKTDAAYYILQRLVTGKGIRARRQRSPLYEADWNRVLGAFCREGRMDRAHSLVALHAKQDNPTISAVTYSILLQGHGQLGQYPQILRVWQDARDYGIIPDAVMMNTLLNALVDCDKVPEARSLFQEIRTQKAGTYFDEPPPRPNARTYNTMLKGLARVGSLDKAKKLGEEMKTLGLWDFVTTNTLVHAAIVVEDYELAESILKTHTVTCSDVRKRHPNAEAYTEILDAYAKSNQLEKAKATLQLMRRRKVEPTEVTYTCLVAGFGRHAQLDKALQTIEHMSTTGMRPGYVVYNALISALVETSPANSSPEDFDGRVDLAMVVLKSMVESGLRSNEVTMATIISALGRCNTPRVDAAKMLVEQLTSQSLLEPCNSRIVAALIQTCGAGMDIAGALNALKTLKSPDVTCVNAFLDASCRCGRDQLAFRTFDHYFRKGRLKPDVISYTVLITALLKKETPNALASAFSWYRNMKTKAKIDADTTLVDTVLKSLLRTARSRSLSKTELLFVVDVLGDADQLSWEDGQLQRRKKVVRNVLGEKLRNLRWGRVDTSTADLSEEDELFRRKGWNQVDSGFRLWGSTDSDPSSSTDDFLKSKGWNDVDSGFRIL